MLVASHAVIVKSLPFAGSIAGIDSVCQGASLTLTISESSAGFWSTSNLRASISSTGVVTGISPGIDTIYYNASNSCAVAIATFIITVNPLPVAGIITGDDSLCVSATITLTKSSSSGNWYSSNSHALISMSGIVTGHSSGFDTIMYKVINSCGRDSVSKKLKIKPLPNPGSITGVDSLCPGDVVALFDPISGGVWAVTNNNLSVSFTGTVSGISVGRDTVLYELSNDCGTAYATKYITVKSLPDAGTISGLDSICVGDSTILTGSIAGGVWTATNNNIAVGGAHISQIKGINPGLDTVVHTVSNACGSSATQKPINILPLPDAGTISGIDTVCVNGAVVFADSIAGGYWWSSNAHVFINATTGIAIGETTGLDTVYYATTNSCGTSNAKLPIIILTKIVPVISGNTLDCIGKTDTVFGTTPGGVWTASNTNASVYEAVITGANAGKDTIYYTITNICGTGYDSLIVTIYTKEQCDSLNGVENTYYTPQTLKVFPNPNDGTFTIDVPFEGDVSILITDIVGKKVFSKTIESYSGGQLKVSPEKVPPGIYLLHLAVGQYTFVNRIIVNKN